MNVMCDLILLEVLPHQDGWIVFPLLKRASSTCLFVLAVLINVIYKSELSVR
jgi:hypothetical protein